MSCHSPRIVFLLVYLLALPFLRAGELPNQLWEVLVVSYPPDRTVSVTLGGGEKTLTSKGICEVRWRDDVAAVAVEVENLPAPHEIGWPGRQYVLWAVDSEKRMLNLGVVPLAKNEAKWRLQVPFRTFGLLVTAESDPQADAPSAAVVLESLLPTNPSLVVPVLRVEVPLEDS